MRKKEVLDIMKMKNSKEDPKEEKKALKTSQKEEDKKEASGVSELKSKLKDFKTKLSDCEKERDEVKDSYQRLRAEFDNFKKRTQKEKESIYIDSVADAVKSMLPVVDNFERALAQDTDNVDGIMEGMKMVYRQLLDAIESLGVEVIPSIGEKFDPKLHNAVMHVEDEEQEDNIVVEEFQKGYCLKGKVIRHSMVKVAN